MPLKLWNTHIIKTVTGIFLLCAFALLSSCQPSRKPLLYPTAQDRSIQQLCGNFDHQRHRRDKRWEQSPAELLMVSETSIRMYYRNGTTTSLTKNERFPIAPGNYRCY